ncbi:hypothetical protein K8B72_14025 [Pseudomonas aeruginosa]|uniref:hypothetical protein n=1 Tax=Pseudomonas aeruginosa TaxID=287 RepID=UPI001CA7E087|nr:hypothetical protein [Pseudomonas aeruginosa]UAD00591.1 hypothetical protein K8B72_14025 [Pseudomonas aeruginosa]
MAENVGSIYYTVEANNSSLVNGANAADRPLDSMQESMQRPMRLLGSCRPA